MGVLHTKRRMTALLGALSIAVLVAACSSDGGGTGSDSSHQSGSPAGSGANSTAPSDDAGAGGGDAGDAGADEVGFGELPAESGTPKDGGVVKIAQSPGAEPAYIFPVIPASANSSYTINQFQKLMYRPLYWYPNGSASQIDEDNSLAKPPVYSDDNKTVTIEMKSDYTWSDGNPVTAEDVEFFIQLIEAAIKDSPANWANYTPGQFPDNVESMEVTSPTTLVLHLDNSYNPDWFTNNQLTNVTPLPSKAWNKASADGPALDPSDPANALKIYQFLNTEAQKPAEFATSPIWQVVDGPFKLKDFNPTTGANTMVPNENYGGPQKPRIDELQQLAFTSAAAELNALRSGELTAGPIDASQLGQVPAIKDAGYHVYGLPTWGFNFIMLNFANTSNNYDKVMGQLYLRQALAHLIDIDGLIKSKSVYNGAATASFGSVPGVPDSDFAGPDARVDPYPYDIDAATKLLTDHGWKVEPGGSTTCVSPGDGEGQCGEGIPEGQKLEWTLYFSNQTPVNEIICNAFASEAKKVGITITTEPKTFGYLITHFNNPAAPATTNDWVMEQWGGFTILPYPTASGTFDTEGSGNVGSYSNPKADELMHDSVFGSDSGAVVKEGEFLRKDLPVLWLPSPDKVWAWSTAISGPPDSFAALTQTSFMPEYWYFTE